MKRKTIKSDTLDPSASRRPAGGIAKHPAGVPVHAREGAGGVRFVKPGDNWEYRLVQNSALVDLPPFQV